MKHSIESTVTHYHTKRHIINKISSLLFSYFNKTSEQEILDTQITINFEPTTNETAIVKIEITEKEIPGIGGLYEEFIEDVESTWLDNPLDDEIDTAYDDYVDGKNSDYWVDKEQKLKDSEQ